MVYSGKLLDFVSDIVLEHGCMLVTEPRTYRELYEGRIKET